MDRIVWATGVGVLLVAPSVFTVFRYTNDHLQGDGVWQSVMSVQDVDLFYWGQDRFFAILPLLASPISNPTGNLFVLLLINAVSFHALLFTICHLGLGAIADPPDRRALVISYLVLTASAHWVFTSATVYSFALDASPHATAWLLALWSYQLWKRRSTPARVVAGLLVIVSVGLSPQALLLVGLLALVDAIRSGRWRVWSAFGSVWFGALVLWSVLGRVWGQDGAPIDPVKVEVSYFSFSLAAFLEGVTPSITTILAAFRPLPMILGVLVAACALLVVRPRWTAMMPRLAFAVVFTIVFWAVFTANTWTSMNQYNLRYYFPVTMLPVVAITVPLAAAAVRIAGPVVVRWSPAVLATGALFVTLLAGPLRPPADSIVLRQTQATADYVRDHDVVLISGYYWDMWPVLYQTLADGRDAHFVAGPKSGGDPHAYRDALSGELAAGRTPTAMCLNDATAICGAYLDYWTEPGWTVTDLTCPVPPVEQLLGSPPMPQCHIMQFTGTAGS